MKDRYDKPISPEELYRRKFDKLIKDCNKLTLSDIRRFKKFYDIFKDRDCKKILDIGCGPGKLKLVFDKFGYKPEVYGVDIEEKVVKLAIDNGVKCLVGNLGKDRLPFEDASFDGILCSEIIEHVFDTDYLLEECHRVLRKDGIMILTTPNLASWFNRIVMLFGYRPFSSEVSLRYDVGAPRPFTLYPEKDDDLTGSGHIRLFTMKSLIELSRLHDFKVIERFGFGIDTDIGFGKKQRLFCKILNMIFSSPSFASDIGLVLRKA